MMELLEYRVKLIERLGEAAREFRLACESIDDPFTKGEGEWTLHQIASHTRDVEKMVYGARIRQTQSEDNPEFTSFNPDDWMDWQYNKDESFAGILDEFAANVEKLCADLKTMPLEAWSRESRHETIGEGLTVQLWVERSLAHIEEHLQAALLPSLRGSSSRSNPQDDEEIASGRENMRNKNALAMTQ